jgi:hypothetical protein
MVPRVDGCLPFEGRGRNVMEPSLPTPLPPVPDLLHPVYAFRDWRITADGLTSPRTGVPWPGPVLAAECHPRTAETLIRAPHRAPGRDCSCGIHGYFRPGYETSKVDYRGVTGIIRVWGEVELHHEGVRAQFARVVALGVYARWTRRQKAAVNDVAGELSVDVVDLHDLEDAATRYATAVPPDLVPAARRSRRSTGIPSPTARVVIFGH